MAQIVINNRSFELPEGVSNEGLEIEFSPFKPASWSNTQHTYDMGQNVTEIGEGVYLQHWYDHSTVLQLQQDDETGEQWDEWLPLEKDEYKIVVTRPQVVGKEMSDFSAREQALYRIVMLVKEVAGKTVTTKWTIRAVDTLPEIKERNVSTPANTSNVSWGGVAISDSVVLLTVDGWTGSRDDTKRTLYVLSSAYPELVEKNDIED